MLDILLPLYTRLSSTKLPEKCARLATQNANECVNGAIWKRCPKVQWYGRRSIQIGATVGVLVFNAGEEALARLQREFGLIPGDALIKHSEKRDVQRTSREVISSGQWRERSHRLLTERDRQIRKEGVTYAAGRYGA